MSDQDYYPEPQQQQQQRSASIVAATAVEMDDGNDQFQETQRFNTMNQRSNVVGESDVIDHYFIELERSQKDTTCWSFIIVIAAALIMVT